MKDIIVQSKKLYNMVRYLIYGIILSVCMSCTQVKAPGPHGPVPSQNQMSWQEMEYYAFVHFSLNTYTDQSWGY